jgi:hypothetical protein
MIELLNVVYGGIAVLGALFLAAWIIVFMLVYRQDRLASGRQQRTTRTDLANMMILLQTMRDLLEQQKGLARQFNAVLEKKAAAFRQQIEVAMAEIEEIRQALRALRAGVAPARELPRGDVPPTANLASTSEAPKPEPPKRPVLLEMERPALRVLATPKENAPSQAVLDGWVGLDFGPDTPDPLTHDVPDVTPQRPADAETAREAFRTLLNREDHASKPPRPQAGPQLGPRLGSGNGRDQLTPLQASVYEYSDAGMSTTEIAQELGIGRGEVRLILGLRKDRSG